jgi:hypothetical protein
LADDIEQVTANPPTITEQFPPVPLKDLITGIADFPTMSQPEKQAFIKKLVERHPILHVNWGGDWRYRRARLLQLSEVPESVDELIWRKGVPAALGRANSEGFQVLYLADRADTAFAEIRANERPKNPVVLTEFSFLPGHGNRIIPIGELYQIQRTGRGTLLREESASINDMINACNRDDATSLLIADSFLLDCLMNWDDNYELSSSVAMSMFDKYPSFSTVGFPSMRLPGAVNFAVRADRVWNDWGIFSVRRGRTEYLAQGYYGFTDIRHVIEISRDGRLKWDADLDEDYSCKPLNPLWNPLSVA